MENESAAPDPDPFSKESSKKPGRNNGKYVIINFESDRWTIDGEIKGFRQDDVLYYDMKHVSFINNTGLTRILELVKILLKDGVEVRFVNVNKAIREKIKTLGLEHILICI